MEVKIYPKNFTCPTCNAKPGDQCISNKGELMEHSHTARVALYREELKKIRSQMK